GGAETAGVEPGGVEPGGAESEGAESGGAEPRGTASPGGPLVLRHDYLPGRSLSPQNSYASDTGTGGAGVNVGAGGAGGAAAAGPGGARTRGTGAAGTGGIGGAGAGDPTEPGAVGAGGAGAGGTGAGGVGAGGAGAGGARAAGTGAGGAGAGGARAVDPRAGGAGGTVRPRPYFVPLLQQPASPLLAPSPYSEQTGGLTERREPASRPASRVRIGRRVPHPRPPPVPSTHAMALRPSSVPLRVPLPAPPESSLPAVPDPESDRSCDSDSTSPPSVGGECALGTDVLEDRQEDFECLAAAVPRFATMLLAPEGDPDAPDIPNPRSYAEAITSPYSSQWQASMDTEMAFWKSTGTYVDAVSPSRANIVDGMWIFRVKRPPGSPPAFKARYVARGFSQRQGVDYFQTFSPTPKMTTLWVLLHVAAQSDFELHFLDFSTAFLQGSLHEEIWLRRPPGFTGLFPAGTQWSLQRPVYGLCQAHDTLRLLGLLILLTRRCFYASTLRCRRSTSSCHSLSAPPSDESVEPSGPYPELVGCLMYLMTCTRPNLTYPLSLLARYVAPGRHRKVHWDAAKSVLRYLCSTLCMGLVLGGRGPVVLTGHTDASWVDDSATQRSWFLLAHLAVL
ncbi:unnamed protein product, partial [Closterium sp. NIES-54]